MAGEIIIGPAGLSEAGTWGPSSLPPPVQATGYLADDVDPSTGELASISKGIHPIDASVLFVLRTERGKALAAGNAGIEASKLRKLGDGSKRETQTTIADAIRPLQRRGDVTGVQVIVGTAAETGATDMAAGLVVYDNRATGEKKKKAEALR